MNYELFKTKAKALKFLAIENYKVNNLKGIIPEIKENIIYNIITQKSINPYTFLLEAINQHKQINELYITTYRISEKAAMNIKYMLENEMIKKLTLLVNDNYETLMRDKAQLLIKMDKEMETFTLIKKNSHTKITLINAGKNYLVISGSGNYSTNPKIEQYTIIKSKELYDFHKQWIDEEKGKL